MTVHVPKRGEVWKNAKEYVFILLVCDHAKTEEKMVVYQHLTQDEKMVLGLQGGQLVSVKLRKPYVVSLSEFIYGLCFVRK